MTENLKLNEEDQEILNDYRDYLKKEKEIKGILDELKPLVVEIMEEFKMKKIERGDFNITYIAESTTEQFDTAKFKKENPKIVEQYLKESTKKAYVKATLKE